MSGMPDYFKPYAERYAKDIREHEKIVAEMVELIGRSIAINTMPKLSALPTGAEELERRRQALFDLYRFVEQNYASALVSGVLFAIEINCRERWWKSDAAMVAEDQKLFEKGYRSLYHALHDYINTTLKSMNTLYEVNDNSGNLIHIWEADSARYTELWELQYGRPFNDDLVEACQWEEFLQGALTICATDVRDALTVFSQNYKSYEWLVLLYAPLTGEVPQNAGERLNAYEEYCRKNPADYS